MAAGYQVWYGHGIVLADTAVRMEARDYPPLLTAMGFKFVQVIRYCPSTKWGKVMMVAQYLDHKLPSKLLRIDHETEAPLKQWRKDMARITKERIKVKHGMVLPDFATGRKLRCPNCNSVLPGFEYVQSEPTLRLKTYCKKKGHNPCKYYIEVDLETRVVHVKHN